MNNQTNTEPNPTIPMTSAHDGLVQCLTENLQGPLRHLTTEWKQAKLSTERLKDLHPEFIGPGHGLPMFGNEFKRQLEQLVQEFDRVAVPEFGKYTEN